MSATAAHPTKVYIRTDATAPTGPDEVGGINSVEFSPSVSMLDITDFKDTSGAKKKLAGLVDGSASVSGDADFADSIQTILRAAAFSGASVWLTVHFNPTGSAGQKGYQVECKVGGFKVSGAVDAKTEFSEDLQFNGVPTLV